MSLAFLSPDAAPSGAVRARSPMERSAMAAGAQLAVAEGWNVPDWYSDLSTERAWLTETVGFSDRCSLTKLELAADPAALAAIVASASAATSGHATADGLVLQQGLAAGYPAGGLQQTWWCPVTPGRVLVLSEPKSAAPLRAALAQATAEAQGTASVLDVTCGLAALSLLGPGARELLARFCAIDVRPSVTPPGGFRPGSVARAPGYVLVEGHDRLLVLVGWALGEYLWQVVADAAAHLGGGPVGAQALSQHLADRDA